MDTDWCGQDFAECDRCGEIMSGDEYAECQSATCRRYRAQCAELAASMPADLDDYYTQGHGAA